MVENPERLRLLLVLTVADIRAVGPGVWNGWKGQLLRDLYGSTEALFRGGRGSDPAILLRQDQKAAADLAREKLCSETYPTDPGSRTGRAQMEDAYFNAFSTDEHAAHYQPGPRSRPAGARLGLARVLASHNTTEVAVAARDRRGLFADLAGCFAAVGANVVGARVYTSTAGQALDIFQLQDAAGAPFGAENPQVAGPPDRGPGARRARRGPPSEPRRPPDHGRTAAFAVPPRVGGQ